MTNTKLDIDGNLLKLRQAKKYTQATLAKAIGINQPNYCDMEANRIMPTIPTLQKLAEFLEVPLIKLLEEEEEKATTTNNNIHNQGILGSVGNNATNNFFESKEIEEKLQNALKEAFTSMVSSVVATEMAKLTKVSV